MLVKTARCDISLDLDSRKNHFFAKRSEVWLLLNILSLWILSLVPSCPVIPLLTSSTLVPKWPSEPQTGYRDAWTVSVNIWNMVATIIFICTMNFIHTSFAVSRSAAKLWTSGHALSFRTLAITCARALTLTCVHLPYYPSPHHTHPSIQLIPLYSQLAGNWQALALNYISLDPGRKITRNVRRLFLLYCCAFVRVFQTHNLQNIIDRWRFQKLKLFLHFNQKAILSQLIPHTDLFYHSQLNDVRGKQFFCSFIVPLLFPSVSSDLDHPSLIISKIQTLQKSSQSQPCLHWRFLPIFVPNYHKHWHYTPATKSKF